MTSTEILNGIANELKRVQIQNHPKYAAWSASLPAHTKRMLESILENDLTPESILFAKAAPRTQRGKYQFVSIIEGGDPNLANMLELTNFALNAILIKVREFQA